MPIGLISDLAVGTDGGGSHGWSRQDETLIGLTIGAPPDLLSPRGQNWGLVAFSPRGLRQHGYAAFIEMLRAALRHAGGVRIDHVMGLSRLWVRAGGRGRGGRRLSALPGATTCCGSSRWNAQRHRADRARRGSRHRAGRLPGAAARRRHAWACACCGSSATKDALHARRPTGRRARSAMTSTHDLPTVAGWWAGRDLDWRARLGLMRDEGRGAARPRARPRALWQAFRDSGAALHDAPPPDQRQHAADAAARHVGRAACDLGLLPLEDALGWRSSPTSPARCTSIRTGGAACRTRPTRARRSGRGGPTCGAGPGARRMILYRNLSALSTPPPGPLPQLRYSHKSWRDAERGDSSSRSDGGGEGE